MNHHRPFAAGLIGAALVLGACGADQDPALELPETSTTSPTGDATGVPSGTVAEEVVLENIQLSGAAEVPGPGDEDGDGFANVFLNSADSPFCYDLSVNGIAPASAAHIHQGGADEAGPVVITLETPSEGSAEGCVEVDAALVDAIEADPSGFYVNVHNADFPNGALRGQLGS